MLDYNVKQCGLRIMYFRTIPQEFFNFGFSQIKHLTCNKITPLFLAYVVNFCYLWTRYEGASHRHRNGDSTIVDKAQDADSA